MGSAQSSKVESPKRSSVLEEHLSRNEWDECRYYLKSNDAVKELQTAEGLVCYENVGGKGRRRHQQKRKMIIPPLWCAIFHRAPLDIVETMYAIRCGKDNNSNDAGNVLAEKDLLHVALEDRERRSSNGDGNINKNNEYNPEEYFQLIQFLVRQSLKVSQSSSSSTTSPFVLRTCTMTEASVQKRYTPLGHAISNRCVNADMVRYLCTAYPDSIDVDCIFIDEKNEYDVSTLALSLGQPEKRDLILRGSQFYKGLTDNDENKEDSIVTNDDSKLKQQQLPPLEDRSIETAIKTAAVNGEWAVVREILPLLSYKESQSPEWLHRVRNDMDKYYTNREQTIRKEKHLRKYYGMAMYDVDIMRDLISTVTPKRKRRIGEGNVTQKQQTKLCNAGLI